MAKAIKAIFWYWQQGRTPISSELQVSIAEVGAHRHELTGPLAFAAWLGVHAALLTTAHAKVEAILEWVWDYFGSTHVDPILDRPDQMNIDLEPRREATTVSGSLSAPT